MQNFCVFGSIFRKLPCCPVFLGSVRCTLCCCHVVVDNLSLGDSPFCVVPPAQKRVVFPPCFFPGLKLTATKTKKEHNTHTHTHQTRKKKKKKKNQGKRERRIKKKSSRATRQSAVALTHRPKHPTPRPRPTQEGHFPETQRTDHLLFCCCFFCESHESSKPKSQSATPPFPFEPTFSSL